MHKKLNWQAYSSGNRNAIIEKVKEVISISEGCIMNFNMFSDLAISLAVEIPENGVQELFDSLTSVLKVSGYDATDHPNNSIKECIIFLNVSFSTGKGEMKMDIPAVPG